VGVVGGGVGGGGGGCECAWSVRGARKLQSPNALPPDCNYMTLTHMLNDVPTHHQQGQGISLELHDN